MKTPDKSVEIIPTLAVTKRQRNGQRMWIPSDRMRRDVQSCRLYFFNKRVSIVNYVSPDTRPEEMLVDDSANTTVRQLGDALTELEVHGHFFGSCSLTLVLHGTDARALEHQAAEAMKAMAVHDGQTGEHTACHGVGK
jgi:hypothetical protein